MKCNIAAYKLGLISCQKRWLMLQCLHADLLPLQPAKCKVVFNASNMHAVAHLFGASIVVYFKVRKCRVVVIKAGYVPVRASVMHLKSHATQGR